MSSRRDLDAMSPSSSQQQKTVQGSPLHKATQGILKPKTWSKLWRLHLCGGNSLLPPFEYKRPSKSQGISPPAFAQTILTPQACLQHSSTRRVPDPACSADETASWNLQTKLRVETTCFTKCYTDVDLLARWEAAAGRSYRHSEVASAWEAARWEIAGVCEQQGRLFIAITWKAGTRGDLERSAARHVRRSRRDRGESENHEDDKSQNNLTT
jgi:hypothetical protein